MKVDLYLLDGEAEKVGFQDKILCGRGEGGFRHFFFFSPFPSPPAPSLSPLPLFQIFFFRGMYLIPYQEEIFFFFFFFYKKKNLPLLRTFEDFFLVVVWRPFFYFPFISF